MHGLAHYAKRLDIELNEIPDWNRCSASIGYPGVGALVFSEPEICRALIKDIIESIYDGGADMILTLCPVCQMNVEVYQNHINQKYKTNFKMPVVCYSTLMSGAYGKTGKEAGLDGQGIKTRQLEDIASQ
jgi:heterodisulfide reductase subunit B